MSAEARVDEVDTTFIWYKEGGGVITPATASNGVFTFDQTIAGERIYCLMTNEKFPKLRLETTPVEVVLLVNFISHPQDTTVAVGCEANFTVAAEPVDGVLSYQWQLLTDDADDWTSIEGATENSYTVPEVTFDDNGHQYRCQITITMSDGSTIPVYSNSATLYIVAEPSIISHPQNTTVAVGTTATFTISAEAADADEGGVLSYQWQLSTDGGSSWKEIPEATESRYTTPEVTLDNNGDQYRCEVKNTKNGVDSAPVYSSQAVLSVVHMATPSITEQPQHKTFKIGATATFTVSAEVADEGGTLSYQWQRSTDGGNVWDDIDGAIDPSCTISEVTYDRNGEQYRCEVKYTKDGVSSKPVYSDPAVLSVVAEPSIISHPQSTTVAVGATATFTIAAEAADADEGGVLSYQWQLSTDGGNVW